MFLRETEAGVFLQIKLIPRAKKNEIVGIEAEALKIRLTAPPVDNEANDMLIRFLAKLFSLPRRDIELVKGVKSRMKLVLIQNRKSADLQKLLGELEPFSK